jgi:hypoxanthine phosphoribosyltransferase
MSSPSRSVTAPHVDVERVLLSAGQIRTGIERVAHEITLAFAGHELLVVGVLKGSCVFVADLIRLLPLSIRLAFVWAESYRSGTTPGDLELLGIPPDEEIRHQNVLLVDDILDSGRTLAAVREVLAARAASQVRTCVFLDKPARRAQPLEADFRCFEVADEFVVGYGLDFAGRYRNLPYVGVLRPEVLGGAAGGERS